MVIKVFNGALPNLSQEKLNSLENSLGKFFPKEMFFPENCVDLTEEDPTQTFKVPTPNSSLPLTLDINPNEDYLMELPFIAPNFSIIEEISKPIKSPLKKSDGSISVYKTKNLKLRPASAYAKPSSDGAKDTFTVRYKEKIAETKTFDPKEEAIKLANIKEKIYASCFLKKSSLDEKSPIGSDRATTIVDDDKTDESNEHLKDIPVNNQKRRRKSLFVENVDENNIEPKTNVTTRSMKLKEVEESKAQSIHETTSNLKLGVVFPVKKV